MNRALAVAVAAAFLACGCARQPEQVTATYVSPVFYQSMDCQQLGLEATRVSAAAGVASGQQSHMASRDKALVGVGVLVFWPALLFLGGNDAQTAELARLKGEKEAIEQTSIAKNCGIQFQPAPPAATTAAVAKPAPYPANR